MTDAWGRNGETSVTIKYDKGYEATWVVFREDSLESLREKIIGYFGIDRASVTGLTLNELVINVTSLAHGVTTAATVLRAAVIPDEEQGQSTGEDPWEGLDNQPAPNPILAKIQSATSVRELQLLWVQNQAAVSDPEIQAAWKARGKALQAVAA